MGDADAATKMGNPAFFVSLIHFRRSSKLKGSSRSIAALVAICSLKISSIAGRSASEASRIVYVGTAADELFVVAFAMRMD